MKLPGHITLLICLLGPCFCLSAWSGIYVYTTENGNVSLNKVLAGMPYGMVVPDSVETVAALPQSTPKPLKLHPIDINKAKYDSIVEEVARTHGIEGALLHAVISVESNYNAKAVSRQGAVGLMQLMPATARRYGVSDSFDPIQNLHGGAKYLRALLTLFNNDVSLALAAYNAGENAVIKNGNHIPPFPETRDYVPRVMGFYRQYQVKL